MDRSQNLRQLMKSTAESNKDKAKQLKQIRLKQKSDQQQLNNTTNVENTYDTTALISPSYEAPIFNTTESNTIVNTNINIKTVKQSKDFTTNKSNLPVGFFDDPFQGSFCDYYCHIVTYPITLCLRLLLVTPPCRLMLSLYIQAILILHIYFTSVYIPLYMLTDSYARGVDPKKVLEEDKANQIQHLTTFFNEVYIYYYYILLLCTIIIYYYYALLYIVIIYYHHTLLCTIIMHY